MPEQNPLLVSPRWRLNAQLTETPAPAVFDWLFNQDSLTRRLTRLCAEGFSVTPLFEGWQALRPDECAALALPEQSLGWVREVYLRGNGQKWVFARSVAAQSALQQGGLNMSELGTRSLGELLFCDEAFERGPLEVCCYPAAWLPAVDAIEGLWARRSCFSRGPLILLVAEVFLPNLWRAVERAGPAVTERR